MLELALLAAYTNSTTAQMLATCWPKVLLDANGHRHDADVQAEAAKPWNRFPYSLGI